MTNQHTGGTSTQAIELTEGDLEQVTGGAMIAASTIVKSVAVREDPCAGGQVTMARR